MSEIEKLDMDVREIKEKLDGVYNILAQVNESLKTLNLGLYGDEKNNHPGVIKKQESLEQKIALLEQKIKDIEIVNDRQEIALKTKKGVWSLGLEVIKYAAVLYLVAKGIFGFDNLFGKFF